MSLNEVQTTRLVLGLLGIALIIIAPSYTVNVWKKQRDPFKGIFFGIGMAIFGIGFLLTFLVWGY